MTAVTGATSLPPMAGTAAPARSASAGSTSACAADLERALGCPFDSRSAVSLAAAVRADEEELVPAAAFEAVTAAGALDWLVPVELGGRLTSFEALLGIVRAISRRDLVVSVGLGSTFLAAAPVWLWGDDSQRETIAARVLAGEFGTAAISEDGAGSDLLATRTRATTVSGGYMLDGRKWLVGNGRRSSFASVLAAADPSYGMFLVDLGTTERPGLTRLPKVPTLGLRGHDLSGFELEGYRVGIDAALGRPGRGIEMVSGVLQLTRTLVGGMSLGAADTALRIALRHARERVLYGAPALALPPVRSLLARGFADALAGECTALAAARGLDVAPRRMALWSAVAKYVVPGFCQDAVAACGEVLSARGYLREGPAGGAFQKLARDAAITPVFEGTRLVQLETVRSQLASGARRPAPPDHALRDLFGFNRPVPPWSPARARPSITYGGADEVVDLLDATVDRLQDERELSAVARTFVAVRNHDRPALRAAAGHRSPDAYDLARRHCLVHAAACCLHTWFEARERLGHLAADPAWVIVALCRVLERLGVPQEPHGDAEDRLVRWLEALDDDDMAFSLLPLRLAPQCRQ